MHYTDYKTILSPKNGMNLYRGCSHGCIYCDSRSVCYGLKHDFEDIEVKRYAAHILDAQLAARRKPCMIGTGAMCDPYIPLENELRLTRQCLEVILRRGFGVTILTKSPGVLRDLDILKAINKKTKCVVQFTLTTFDDDLCSIIEPNVAVTSERAAALDILRDAGIPTVVWLSPILPFINDTEDNLRGLLDYCVSARARGIIFFGFGTTMREGSREFFFQNLDKNFPGMKQRYIDAFGSRYECLSPNNARLTAVLRDICDKHSILRRPDEVFGYLRSFESKERQLSLFDNP